MSGGDDTTRIEQIPAMGYLPERDGLPTTAKREAMTPEASVPRRLVVNREDRYRTNQERDDKSGYRLSCRPIAMVEAQIAHLIHTCGGQPVHLVVDHGLRVGVPAAESLRALVRLVASGALHYDVALDLVTKPTPPAPWWRRLMRWAIGQPGCWLIAFVSLTTGFCIAFT